MSNFTGNIQFDNRTHRQIGGVEKRSAKRKREAEGLTAKDKSRIFMLIIAAGLIAISVIVLGAFGASINYQNNQLRDQNASLQSEVESLQSELESSNNIAMIEKKATNELGMVYPDGSKLVMISPEKKKQANSELAANLKENAFR